MSDLVDCTMCLQHLQHIIETGDARNHMPGNVACAICHAKISWVVSFRAHGAIDLELVDHTPGKVREDELAAYRLGGLAALQELQQAERNG